ncbi:MAG: endo-1,4-beta-xylanase [Saprospiraceae bacterium]
MKLKTLLVLLLFSNGIIAQNDSYHDTLTNQLQNIYNLTSGNWVFTGSETTNIGNAISYGNTTTQNTATGQDFSIAVNLDIPSVGTNPWDAGYFMSNINPVQTGDKILAVIWVRTVSTPLGGQSGRLNIFVEDAQTYHKEFFIDANPTFQWQQYLIPFESTDNYPAGDLNFGMHLAYQEQEIEIGGMTMINFGNSVSLSALPQNLNIGDYDGIASNAPWRTAAANRIEQHRKANMQLQIVDDQGNPIPNASVHVEMLRHHYAFGTAVVPRLIANNSLFNQTYQNKLTDLDGNGHGFNWVVNENALKWRAWEEGWTSPAETVNSIQWLLNNNIKFRGHVLVWPGWGNMPTDMQQNQNNPTYLKNRIDGHLNSILNYQGIRNKIEEWDVVNEIAHVRDLEYALQGTPNYTTGREIYPHIVNQAKQEDANLVAYLNDYNILNNGSVNGGDYQLFKSMIQEIIGAGASVDGIGFQAHMGSALIAPDSLYAIIEDAHQAFNLPIKITEYDQSDILPDTMQAKYTGDFLTMIFSHPATNGFLMWGFWDGAHWLGNAPLYDMNWNPKPTHAVFTDLLFNQWWTDSTLTTDGNGNLDLRGFKGDYRITTTHNNQTVTGGLKMTDDVNQTITLFPVGTNSVLTEVNVKVFPNPVIDYLSLELPYAAQWNVSIIDAQGKIIYQNTSTDFIQFLDFQSYSTGTYFVQVEDDKGNKMVKKIIRN